MNESGPLWVQIYDQNTRVVFIIETADVVPNFHKRIIN